MLSRLASTTCAYEHDPFSALRPATALYRSSKYFHKVGKNYKRRKASRTSSISFVYSTSSTFCGIFLHELE